MHLTGAGERLPKAYIYCTPPRPGDVFQQFAQRARTETGWRYFEIDASHNVHITAPAGADAAHARRARGEPVDFGELQAAGRAAMNAIVARQAECGVDIGNNGEQQRESVQILDIRDRLTGLGGSWQRRQRADVERYPVFDEGVAPRRR